jgi:hypothetical protein
LASIGTVLVRGGSEASSTPGVENNSRKETSMTNTQVLKSEVVRASSWDELKGLADFDPLQPAVVPAGTEVDYLAFTYFPFPGTALPTTRNGIFVAQYRLPEGYLRIEYGWGMGLPSEDIPSDVPHGQVRAGKYEATWVRGRGLGGVGPPTGGKSDASYLRLAWRPDPSGASGSGWKITTDSLTLEELVKVAESMR